MKYTGVRDNNLRPAATAAGVVVLAAGHHVERLRLVVPRHARGVVVAVADADCRRVLVPACPQTVGSLGHRKLSTSY